MNHPPALRARATLLAGGNGYGYAWLENFVFGDGVTECDLRSKRLLK